VGRLQLILFNPCIIITVYNFIKRRIQFQKRRDKHGLGSNSDG